MMVDILCAVFSGMPNGNNVSKMFGDPMSKKRELGHFFCAIRIDAFRDMQEFKVVLQEMAERVRNELAIDPEIRQVTVLGGPEKTAWRERGEQGIPMPEHDWKLLECVA